MQVVPARRPTLPPRVLMVAVNTTGSSPWVPQPTTDTIVGFHLTDTEYGAGTIKYRVTALVDTKVIPHVEKTDSGDYREYTGVVVEVEPLEPGPTHVCGRMDINAVFSADASEYFGVTKLPEEVPDELVMGPYLIQRLKEDRQHIEKWKARLEIEAKL